VAAELKLSKFYLERLFAAYDGIGAHACEKREGQAEPAARLRTLPAGSSAKACGRLDRS